jgi:hypothetical protein
MDRHFGSHVAADAYVLTIYTALRPRGQRRGSVPVGRNGYRYSCSATGVWDSYRPIGRQDRAKAGHLPAYPAMVHFQSLACFLNWPDHAGVVRSFSDLLHHLVWRYRCDDYGARSSRAAGKVEWTAWPLCRIADHSCADHWWAHLEGTRACVCVSHSYRSGSHFESASVVHNTRDPPRTEPWGDESRLNSMAVPLACGGNGDRIPGRASRAIERAAVSGLLARLWISWYGRQLLQRNQPEVWSTR